MDEKRIYEDLIAGTPTKVCQLKEFLVIGVVNAILSCAICLMLLVLICCFSMSKLSECSCICLLIVTIPTLLFCTTYIIGLCIKRLPDKDKSEERQYRFAQFYLSKIQKEEKQT